MKCALVCAIISSMKKVFYIVLIVLLILSFSLGAVACKAKVKSGKDYYTFTYNSRTDSFVKMGSSLRFGDRFETFEYSFGEDDLTVYGAVEHTDTPDTYVITCSDEVIELVTERYRKSMVEANASTEQIDFFDAIAKNFTPKAQYFVYEGKLFTADSIELFHDADGKSDSFEGVYRMDSSEDLVKLRGGYAYSKDEDGEYTEKTGRYTVSRGILTLISIDEDGEDRYQNGVLMRKRYLMAKVTIPSDGSLLGTSLEEQLETSDFVSKINENLSSYSGKTVTVLCKSYLCTD